MLSTLFRCIVFIIKEIFYSFVFNTSQREFHHFNSAFVVLAFSQEKKLRTARHSRHYTMGLGRSPHCV